MQKSAFSVFVFIWLFPSSRISLDFSHSCLKEKEMNLIIVIPISNYQSDNIIDNWPDFLVLDYTGNFLERCQFLARNNLHYVSTGRKFLYERRQSSVIISPFLYHIV